MDSLYVIALTSFVVALSGALMPGPLLAVTVAHSRKRGFMAGPLATLGHGLLEVAIVAAVLCALDLFLQYKRSIAMVIGIAGGALLVVMGTMMIRNAKKLSFLKEDTAPQGLAAKALNSPIVAGAVSTLSNPYWFLWWAMFGVGMIIWAEKQKFLGLAVFTAAHIAADLLWYSFVSYYIANRKDSIKDGTYRLVIILCGMLLIGFGAYFTLSTMRF